MQAQKRGSNNLVHVIKRGWGHFFLCKVVGVNLAFLFSYSHSQDQEETQLVFISVSSRSVSYCNPSSLSVGGGVGGH